MNKSNDITHSSIESFYITQEMTKVRFVKVCVHICYQGSFQKTTDKEAIKQTCHVILCIADFTGLPYFSGFLSGLKSHGLISHDYLSQSTLQPLQRRRVAMCLRPASKCKRKFCFVSKQACIYCMRSED